MLAYRDVEVRLPRAKRKVRPRGRRWFALGVTALLIGLGSAFAAPPPGPSVSPLRLTFADLAACPLVVPGSHQDASWQDALPAAVRQALTHRVRITGYVLPVAESDATPQQFWLMRDQSGCCSHHPPPPSDYLIVKAPPPGAAVPPGTPVSFEGVLRITPVTAGGTLVGFFELTHAVPVNL